MPPTPPHQVDPFTHGARRALAYLGLWTQHSGAQRVHVASRDPAVARQCLLHLPCSVTAVSVPDGVLPKGASWPWPVSTGDVRPEVTLCPFSLETGDLEPHAPRAIGCFRNTLSYRKLLAPRGPALTVRQARVALARHGYALQQIVGICPPHFILWWSLSALAGPRAPALHFRLAERALQNLVKGRGWSRYFSHLVVFDARR